MLERPIIAVLGCNKIVEDEPAQAVKNRYIEAVSKYADCIPLIVPSLGHPEDAIAIVSRVDAIMLTGSSSNVDPRHYRSVEPGKHPQDNARDRTAIALVKAAQHFGVPIIGVCRGMQEINVALGGTLADGRDASGDDWSHHASDDADLEGMFNHMHNVQVSPASVLARATGQNELCVNSVHYQHLGQLGAGLRIEATSHDGVIEAISSREAEPNIIAVQWHPEWRPEERKHDLAFWRLVGEMARRRQLLASSRAASA